MKSRKLFLLYAALLTFLTAIHVYSSEAVNDFTGFNQPPVFKSGDLSVHFLELGNRYTGDSIYINYGEIDILIDAGSRQSSAKTITTYIDNYIQDGILEFVIATHAHEDHIAGFYSRGSITGIFDYYEIGIIIDFPKTNSNTAVYNSYINARDRAVENGAAHYTALQCFNNEDGAQRIYHLGGSLYLEILYNYYYENYSGSENNYSVCLRIIYEDMQFLFTGDLERDGEDKLADFYEENFGGLGHFVLFKGGHHGSNTSGHAKLMAAITPEYIIICSGVGTAQYRALPHNTYPAQGFIDRAAPYTDRIYITTRVTDYANNEFESFNGNIIFLVSGGTISIICSNNDTILKNTEWFAHNRTMPEAWK